MEEKILSTVCKQVYQKFPEVKGIRPKVKSQPGETYLLVFQSKATTASGASLPRSVRVTVDANGRISKMTTSK